MFCFHRGRRPDAVDPETGERLDDVLMFRVDEPGREGARCSPTPRGIFFTTPALRRLPGRADAHPATSRGSTATSCATSVVEAWLTRAQKRVAKAWLAEHDQ